MPLELFLRAVENKGIKFETDEPMRLHTSFKIGGNADCIVYPTSKEELSLILGLADKYGVSVFCLGKGSNLLVSDRGIEGAVVSLSELRDIEVSGEYIICEAGCSLASVCKSALEASLSGLEFAYGIPGSLGGAVFMNAGAYGGEMSQVVEEALCVDEKGELLKISASDMRFGYRESIFKHNKLIVVAVKLKLVFGNYEEINAKMEELMARRISKQHLEFPSAGSAFKRPEGYFAGALIEQNGLKGVSVGGAQVSEKHAGFIINRGGATADDVKALISFVKDKIYKAEGIELEPEILFIGRE